MNRPSSDVGSNAEKGSNVGQDPSQTNTMQLYNRQRNDKFGSSYTPIGIYVYLLQIK